MKHTLLLTLISCLLSAETLYAELKLPSIFSDGMVLQQKQRNRIWGWDKPGAKITVRLDSQEKITQVNDDGRWQVSLDPLKASYEPCLISINGSSEKNIKDVLIGEVWMCSGQSNMQWPVKRTWNGEIEGLAANYPHIRLLTVPLKGSQKPLNDFKGAWTPSTRASVKNFSAVGYHYGRYLHKILDVPVGLINNAWGGSHAEAWVKRETLETDPRFTNVINEWKAKEADLARPEAHSEWEKAATKWDKANPNPVSTWTRPRSPKNILEGQFRPGNIYGGMMHATMGYGIKGVIWYQGESNSSRAAQYADLFPLLINEWRKEQSQGDFPFYWVQLADYRWQNPHPEESAWAEVREAQTKTLKLPNTGQAVIIDIGEGNDIHPRNKITVANRLVRWALKNDYGFDKIPCQSPTYKSHTIKDGTLTLRFAHTDEGLRSFDDDQVRGFAISGDDNKWLWADAKIIGKNQITVSHSKVKNIKAVRYAWANNPDCNVQAKNGLPLTPFRVTLKK